MSDLKSNGARDDCRGFVFPHGPLLHLNTLHMDKIAGGGGLRIETLLLLLLSTLHALSSIATAATEIYMPSASSRSPSRTAAASRAGTNMETGQAAPRRPARPPVTAPAAAEADAAANDLSRPFFFASYTHYAPHAVSHAASYAGRTDGRAVQTWGGNIYLQCPSGLHTALLLPFSERESICLSGASMTLHLASWNGVERGGIWSNAGGASYVVNKRVRCEGTGGRRGGRRRTPGNVLTRNRRKRSAG